MSCQSVRFSQKRLKNLRSFVIWLLLVLSHFLTLTEPGKILNTMLNIWIWSKILSKTKQRWPQKKWRTSKELHSRDSVKENVVSEDFNCQTTLYLWAELSRDYTVVSQWKQKPVLQSAVSLQLLSKSHMKLLMQGKNCRSLLSLVLRDGHTSFSPNFSKTTPQGVGAAMWCSHRRSGDEGLRNHHPPE